MRVAAILLLAAAAAACCGAAPSRNSVARDDKPAGTHALLSSLGMQRLRVPAAHHRKRLAEQARRHAAGDSRMYVIKLPPSASYYAHAPPAPPAPLAARTLPLPLRSNGKPARVYHWNLPALQRLKNGPQARLDDELDVEGTPTWPAHPNAVDAPAYYVPGKGKPSFRKYFSGNGKPKSFYVIDKDKKPAHYHRLLP